VNIVEVRLTLYALITALESDFRSIIRTELLPSNDINNLITDNVIIDRICDRYTKENPSEDPMIDQPGLLVYLDFADSYKLLLQHGTKLPEPTYKALRSIAPTLDEIAPVRNRVMHMRPLMSGDFAKTYSLCAGLQPSTGLPWAAVNQAIERIDSDPSYVLSLEIPTSDEPEWVMHNLPMPDFDDSGFVGRKEDSDALLKLLRGNNRVITVLGDGGVGKTALVLKVAYDLVELGRESPFDAIIWTSAKTAMFTQAGIQEIRTAFRDYFGLIEAISDGFKDKSESMEDRLSEIYDYLDGFKVLVILDNLETISDERIYEFIRIASEKCKIAITSRIGLGELEYRRRLEGLTSGESALLVREIAKIRNSKALLQISQNQLADVAKQLHFNPLALKWFATSVDAGNRPVDVLKNKDELLDFCLSNVYEKLGAEERGLVAVLLSARKPLNDAELVYITDLEPIELRKRVLSLSATNFVRREYKSRKDLSESVYYVTDFAKEYLLRAHPPSAKIQSWVRAKQKELSGTTSTVRQIANIDKYDVHAIIVENTKERVVARYLQDALQLSKKGEYEAALEKVDNAGDIVPDYTEIYRIAAFIRSGMGDRIRADEDYKTALGINPNSPRLCYFYSGFLLRDCDDELEALEYAEKALKGDPDAVQLQLHYARCLGYAGELRMACEKLDLIRPEVAKRGDKYSRIAFELSIDFYRRIAETEISISKDKKAALSSLEQSILRAKSGVESAAFDRRIRKITAKAVSDYFHLLPNSENDEKINHAFSLIAPLIPYLRGEEAFLRLKDYCEKVYPTKKNFFLVEAGEGGRKRLWGEVMRMLVEGPKKFGFIRCRVHGSVYFNKHSLQDARSWHRIRRGATVSYSVNIMEKGPAAVDLIIED